MEFLIIGVLQTTVPFIIYAAWAFARSGTGRLISKSLSLVWGIVFPWSFVFVAELEERSGVLTSLGDVPTVGLFVELFILSAMTAALLWWSTRSCRVLAGTLIAGAIAGAVAAIGGGAVFVAILVWHFIVAISLIEWADEAPDTAILAPV